MTVNTPALDSRIEAWELNAPQWDAVRHNHGPLLILAGAGSGKTRVITYRIAHLIQVGRVAPWNILAVTFTNKAADEMRERVARLAVERAGGVTLGTFHRTCAEMLRRHGERIGLDRNFTIFDAADQLELVRSAMKDLEIAPGKISAAAVRAEISRAKDELRTHFEYAEYADGFFQQKAAQIFRRYQELLKEAAGLDFGDLIVFAVRLLRESPETLAHYRDRWRFIMVDEYQDTNRAQYHLVRELAAAQRNLAVVGDDDQSIYGWRGADIRNILDFEREYPDAKVVKLEQNYRSTEGILQAAHSVVCKLSGRKDKRLWTSRRGGEKIRVLEAHDEEDEAAEVLTAIQSIMAENGAQRGDFAIMYRTNAQSRAFEEAMVKSGTPYQLVGATAFYGRREVKDLLAYVRCIHNPRDTVSFERIANVPPRGIGTKTLAELAEWGRARSLTAGEAARLIGAQPEVAANSGISARTVKAVEPLGRLLAALDERARSLPLPRFMQAVYRDSGYEELLKQDHEAGEERIENVVELIEASVRYADLQPPEGLAAFLHEVALVSEVDDLRRASDAVTLITLHAAKGLEFRNVFITGFEEELCPHVRSFADPEQMEEERRLAYVGITRAADRLYFSFSRYRGGWGSLARLPSRFLQDIPEELLEWEGRQQVRAASWARIEPETPKRQPPRASERTFTDGQKVRHPMFGDGIVVSGKAGPGGEEVTVAFREAGIKLLSVAFAQLERI